MQQLLISIDHDDVLWPFFDRLLETYPPVDETYLAPDYAGPCDFDEIWACSSEEANRRIQEFAGQDQCRHEPVSGAIEALSKLSCYYRQTILTARNPPLHPWTKLYLDHHFGDIFEGYHHVGNRYNGGPWETKGSASQRLSVACHIDDHPVNIADCVKDGIPAILFGNYPWNRGYELPVGVAYAKDWPAVIELLLPPSGWLAGATKALGH